MLKPHDCLEDAVFSRHVIRMQSRKVSDQYWEWCRIHSRPFLSLSIPSCRSRYAVVEMDLYGLGIGGFDRNDGKDVLRSVLSQPLKRGSLFLVSPVYVCACVSTKAARAMATSLYRIATESLALDQITHEEWMSGKLEQASSRMHSQGGFPPISGEVGPITAKVLLDEAASL
ncbi:MAG: hypothetical protein EHM14_03795 [Methanothrix sp.]|nr:MAG: hypothetical protein EHM14_03795 [Methanothrix sp.]